MEEIGNLQYTKILSPEFIDESGERIGCHITFPGIQNEPVPFVAYKFDSTIHGRKIYSELIEGKFGPIKQFEEDLGKSADRARRIRNYFLEKTDWIVYRHREEAECNLNSSISSHEYHSLITFRHDLRRWPNTIDFPAAPPVTPNWLVKILKTSLHEELMK